jgi:Transposase, Mutator family
MCSGGGTVSQGFGRLDSRLDMPLSSIKRRVTQIPASSREILSTDIASEAETFWTAFPHKLARRGLRSVKLAVFEAEGASRPL